MNWLREPDSEPIPGYRLIEPIGTGGFGEVWKCIAPGGIHKAIKFVYGDLDGAGDEGKGAEQERKALKRVLEVRHPFILSMFTWTDDYTTGLQAIRDVARAAVDYFRS